MPEGKGGSNLRQVKQWQRGAARDYYLRHPDASINDVSRATGISLRTVARAREVLVKEGLLQAGRHAETMADAAVLAAATQSLAAEGPPVETGQAPENEPAAEPQPRAVRRPKGDLLDDEAMREMAGMLDEMADSEDVETTRKRMLRQTQRFIFDPSLHPDTRMSASQLWAKLVEMARAKDLGPGKPLTLAVAIERCEDFMTACGPAVYVPALNNLIAKMEGRPGAQATDVQAPAPTGATEAAGPARHEGDGAPAEVVRAVDLDGGRGKGQSDHDPARPAPGRPGEVGDPRATPRLDAASPWS